MSLFDLLETDERGEIYAGDLSNHVGQIVKMVGLYVDEKTVHTKNNKRMWFGCFLDADGNFFDTIHFPNANPAYPFRGAGCYRLQGMVVEDFGFASLEVKYIEKLSISGNPVMSVEN